MAEGPSLRHHRPKKKIRPGPERGAQACVLYAGEGYFFFLPLPFFADFFAVFFAIFTSPPSTSTHLESETLPPSDALAGPLARAEIRRIPRLYSLRGYLSFVV